MSEATALAGQTLFRDALAMGLEDVIPVMPFDAELHEHSNVDPAHRGKVPGDYYEGKWDGMGSWPDYVMNDRLAERWDTLGANVGCKMGERVVGLDIDVTDDLLAQVIHAYMQELSEGTWPFRVGQVPKTMWLFKVAGGEPIRRRQYGMYQEGSSKQLIEVMGRTSSGKPSQGLLFGMHPTGTSYQWNIPFTVDNLPTITQAQMDALVSHLIDIAATRGWKARKPTSPENNDGTGSIHGAKALDPTLVEPIVNLIPNKDVEYDDFIAVGYAIKASIGEEGWPLFEGWARKSTEKYDAKRTERFWKGFDPNGSAGFGKLVHLARQAHPGPLPGELDRQVRFAISVSKADPVQGIPIEPKPTDIEYVYDAKNNLVANAANIHAQINNSDLWRGVFAYDAFSDCDMVLSPPPSDNGQAVPRRVEDKDYVSAHLWFQRYMFGKIGKTDVISAIDMASQDNTFEPVQEYLRGVSWDRTPRIDNWLFTYAAVERPDDPAQARYLSRIGRKWLISAVARAMRPGCQADHALILEGAQGVGKSTMFQALVPDPDWFSDGLSDFHSKDASEHLQGKWIIEMSELTSVLKSQVEDMRRFLTRRVEQFRPSYARKEVIRPRRSVFCGSTNRDDYLKDGSGERRFWIAVCGDTLDTDGVRRDRDQLWAEALAAYDAGETWHLDPETAAAAKEAQRDRVLEDVWQQTIEVLVAHHQDVSLTDVTALMGVDVNSRSKLHQIRIRACLEAIGFVRNGKFPDSRRARWSRRNTE